MNRYKVIAPMGVTFNPGAVLADLSEEQQSRMRHLITPVDGKKNQWRVTSALMFKHGEEVTTAADVSKAQLVALEAASGKRKDAKPVDPKPADTKPNSTSAGAGASADADVTRAPGATDPNTAPAS